MLTFTIEIQWTPLNGSRIIGLIGYWDQFRQFYQVPFSKPALIHWKREFGLLDHLVIGITFSVAQSDPIKRRLLYNKNKGSK
jgi:hypothetical protein